MNFLNFKIVWGEEANIIWMSLCLAIPLFYLWGLMRRRIFLKRLGGFDVLKSMVPQKSFLRESLSTVMLTLSLIFLTLAYMKPQWGEQTRLVETKSLDIMLLQDVSQSMLAKDVKPSRLLRSRHEIANFVDHLEGDRVGLMAFGASTRLLSPMTQDYNAVKMFLRELDPSMVFQGTDLGLALKMGLDRFESSSIQSQMMVVLSDGEEHDAQALALAEEAARREIKVYTIGIGSSQGVPIPDPRRRGQWKKDAKGQPVLTRLNEDLLKDIASKTGALYYNASQGGFQLTKILDEIRDIERDSIGESEVVEYEQRYFIFLIVGLLLLILEWAMPAGFLVRRRDA